MRRRTAAVVVAAMATTMASIPSWVEAAASDVRDGKGDVRHVRWDAEREKEVDLNDGRTRPIDIAALGVDYDLSSGLKLTLRFHSLSKAWRMASFYLDANGDGRWDYLVPAWRGPHNGVQTGAVLFATDNGEEGLLACPLGRFSASIGRKTMTLRMSTFCAAFNDMQFGLRAKARVSTEMFRDWGEFERKDSWYVDETRWSPVTYGVLPRPYIPSIDIAAVTRTDGTRVCRFTWKVLAPNGKLQQRSFESPAFDGVNEIADGVVVSSDEQWGPYLEGDFMSFWWSATVGGSPPLSCGKDGANGVYFLD